MKDGRKWAWYVVVWLALTVGALLAALMSGTALADEILKDTYRAARNNIYFDYNFHKYYLAAFRTPLFILGIFSGAAPLVFAVAAMLWPRGRANPFERLFGALARSPLGVMFGLAFAGVSIFAFVVLRDFAASADEWSFLFQAHTFAGGEVFRKAQGITDRLLFCSHVSVTDGKIYSLMFPGWPMLLAAGVKLGLPGIVNPLIALAGIATIYAAGRDFFDRRTGVLSAIICMLSPFFLFNSGSYFSHPAGLLFGTGAVWLFYRAVDGRSRRAAFFGGLFLGLELLTRPYDAVAMGVPMIVFGVFVIHSKLGWKQGLKLAALFAGGACVGTALLLWYNNAISGSPWIAPLHYSGASIKPGFEKQAYHIHTLKDAATLTFAHLADLTAVMPAASLLLLAPVLASKKRWPEWFLLAEIAAIVLAYSAYPAYGGNQFGPRYYYSGLGVLSMLLGRGAVIAFEDVGNRLGKRGTFGLSVVGLLAFLLTSAGIISYGAVEREIVEERMQPFEMVRERGITNALVRLENGAGTAPTYDLIRNFYYDDPVLYTRWLGRAVTKSYPDRECYSYRYGGREAVTLRDLYKWPPDHKGEKSILEKIECPR